MKELEAIDKTIEHIDWLSGMNKQVSKTDIENTPTVARHAGYELALADIRRFISTQKDKLKK